MSIQTYNKQVLFDVNMKVNDKDVIGIIGP